MLKNKVSAVILAAGQGTRMKSSLPKVLHQVTGRPMVSHLLATVEEIGVEKAVVVIAPDMDNVKATVAPHSVVIQKAQKGTGDAVKAAKPELEKAEGSILVLYGDSPLIKKETLEAMIEKQEEGASVVVLGFEPENAGRYGRLVVDENGLQEIVEFKDATPEQQEIRLCNSGVMCIKAEKLFGWLDSLTNNNATGEFYLTDLVAIARKEGALATVVLGDEEEMAGANSRADLAMIEKIAQNRLREKFLNQGVTMTDPDSVYFSYDTVLGLDVTIEPNVIFKQGCVIEDNVEIKGFCHFEGTHICQNAIVGPFARLRPGAEIGESCHIGDFVEVKNSQIDKGAKVNHLSYIGDAHIGEKTNIGAGTITCNYDGFFKSKTEIGKNVFIGSDTIIVAPCTIEDGAMTAAGSVITKGVEENALAVTRSKQTVLNGYAEKFREQKRALKEQKSK